MAAVSKKQEARYFWESLWALGIDEAALRGINLNKYGSFTAKGKQLPDLVREVEQRLGRRLPAEDVSIAKRMATWRADPKKQGVRNIGDYLKQVYGDETLRAIENRAAEIARAQGARGRVGAGGETTYLGGRQDVAYEEGHVMQALKERLGPQAFTQLTIKTGTHERWKNAPVLAGMPAWNPLRGDRPGGAQVGAAAAGQPGGSGLGGALRSTRTAAPGVKNPPGPTGLGQIMARTKGMAPGPDGTLAGQTLGGGGGDDGGGGGAATSPVPYVPPLALSATDAEVEAYIKKNFGWMAWALDEPELRATLVDFTRRMGGEEFSDEQLEAELMKLDWWKQKNSTSRARTRQKNEDPATYNQGVLEEMDKLQSMIDQGGTGFNISQARLQEMARTSYKMGWTMGEMRSALAGEFDYNPETGAQAASAVVGNLKQLAGQYLVPLSEATIDQWGKAMIAGTANEETINGYLREQAKLLLPTFAAQIDAGLTPSALVEPYRQSIARELGNDPNTIDFLDPKWNRFINSRDPKTGQPQLMSTYDIQRTIRTDATYGWDKSEGARGQATEFASLLAERFGRAG